jgi:hypothetical protein
METWMIVLIVVTFGIWLGFPFAIGLSRTPSEHEKARPSVYDPTLFTIADGLRIFVELGQELRLFLLKGK